MNPHLDYAQVVPGTSRGRSFGVLDGHFLLPAFDAASLLRRSLGLERSRSAAAGRVGRRVPALAPHQQERQGGSAFSEQPRHVLRRAGRAPRARDRRPRSRSRDGEEGACASHRAADQARRITASRARAGGALLLPAVQPRGPVQAGDPRRARRSRPLALRDGSRRRHPQGARLRRAAPGGSEHGAGLRGTGGLVAPVLRRPLPGRAGVRRRALRRPPERIRAGPRSSST